VQVIPKDEIEAPWRRECEFLWSMISELEKKKGGGDPELVLFLCIYISKINRL
jgi:hypothetical protein